MPPYRKIKAHIWYEGTSHRYTTPGTKVKVICKGQGKKSGSSFSKDGCFEGISVSQTHPVSLRTWLNPVPNDKIFDWSKLKAFADDNINVNEKFQFILGKIENIVGKGENAGYQHFLLFPQCFLKAVFSGSLKVGIVWSRDNHVASRVPVWSGQDFKTKKLPIRIFRSASFSLNER